MYPRSASILLLPLRYYAVLTVLLFGAVEVGYGQRTYATGTITGGIIGAGLTVGAPYGINKTGFETVGTLTVLGIPNNSSNNYYYAGTIYTENGQPTEVGISNILGENEITPAVISANKGLNALLVPLSGSDAYIQFRFNSNINVNTPAFIKLKEKPEVNTTLDLDVLGVLGLSSSNNFTGEVYTGALQPQNYSYLLTSIRNQHIGLPVGNTSNPTITQLLIDKNGEWYARIVPTVNTGTYNSVRLTVQFPPALNLLSLSNSASANVYNAFIEPLGGICSVKPQFTNEGEASGITLNPGVASNLLKLSEIVSNPVGAIDDDPDSYSSFSSGILNIGVLNTVSQTIYFDHTASSYDGIHVRLGLSNDLIGLDLLALNGISFSAYQGSSENAVWTGSLGDLTNLLGLDLLHLISIGGNHSELNLTFKPGIEFDRIKIELNQGLLGLGVLGDALRVYSISLSPPSPEIANEYQPTNSTICESETISFTVTATVPGGEITAYQWQYFDGTDWVPAEGTNDQPTYSYSNTPTSFNGRRYRVRVTGGISGCEQTVYSNEATLSVFKLPGKPYLTITGTNN